ncbi:YigZ family protein [Facklamia miroungae]|uniref:Uncharacterized protein, YigZ family n=1 Tax=Facklamia miroungae TaxID=120956 RepID=A0A1G7SGY0_9LACT|nr:YigZ family protein [Facklamia miroungae]NKZ29653.1 YigZ family protein [Facklamia miroungae]SDG22326.1 uncharacterized protein, YigZ family [Facklamia miroungae]
MFNYISIKEEIIHEIEIKKSRFICYLLPIKNEEDFIHYLNSIQKKHYKANHHCFAYILESDKSIQRMSDDGEPSGTAGLPMLEVLRQEDLTFIAAIVVRYFGGTKLGAGGLIRAYSHSVSQTCQLACRIKNVDQAIFNLEINYAQLDRFNHNLRQMPGDPTILNMSYLETIQIELAIQANYSDEFINDLINFLNGQVQIDYKGIRSVEIDYLK